MNKTAGNMTSAGGEQNPLQQTEKTGGNMTLAVVGLVDKVRSRCNE